ncbi:Glyoxysomal fatty acid beta-oxidation multifunctional protein MFP-a [Capsicum baccatum]|uniref:Glyoxysomal fatty acid beta-oxidation multifunctional protein MFP-a n=1 Tax=Capsicum baccatum TaxID=33114 RepID=A0A2G2VG86_CAPBA|nr:Glyoxysomal fatty acid beta-oxidation multifunctional protein MFP-a [Capsicum baccatum]
MSTVSSLTRLSIASSFNTFQRATWCTLPCLFVEDQYDVVPPDTVSISSLGKRSTSEEPIKKKNPAVMKISPWTLASIECKRCFKRLCDLIVFNVSMATKAQFVLSMPDRIYKSTLIPLMQQDKRLGETTRKSFYLYNERHKVKPDPEIKKYIEKAREFFGVSIDPKLAKLSNKDIVEMILFPSANEACRLYAECIAVKAADIDIPSVMGMGFPLIVLRFYQIKYVHTLFYGKDTEIFLYELSSNQRNDLALVTKVMELTSENVYGTVLSVIMKLLDTNYMATGSKRDLDSQLKTISSNFLVLIISKHKEKVMKERKRNNSHSDDVGYVESRTVNPSMKMGICCLGLKDQLKYLRL